MEKRPLAAFWARLPRAWPPQGWKLSLGGMEHWASSLSVTPSSGRRQAGRSPSPCHHLQVRNTESQGTGTDLDCPSRSEQMGPRRVEGRVPPRSMGISPDPVTSTALIKIVIEHRKACLHERLVKKKKKKKNTLTEKQFFSILTQILNTAQLTELSGRLSACWPQW